MIFYIKKKKSLLYHPSALGCVNIFNIKYQIVINKIKIIIDQKKG
jgi:hypothetical protein